MLSNEKTVFGSNTMCLCCMMNLSSVLLFIPEMMWPFVYSPEEAALHVAVVSAPHGEYVGVFVCFCDKATMPGGPVVQFWASSLTSTR